MLTRTRLTDACEYMPKEIETLSMVIVHYASLGFRYGVFIRFR